MKQIDAFVEVASRYCALIDQRATSNVEDFINEVRETLPLLYYHALQLPDRETNKTVIDLAISHDDWKSAYEGIGELLGCNNLYWEVFDPLAESPDPAIATTISDDLADIWRDLSVGVKLWTTASEAERLEIVWHWRFSFQFHWSNHLVDAMRAINRIVESYCIRESESAG